MHFVFYKAQKLRKAIFLLLLWGRPGGGRSHHPFLRNILSAYDPKLRKARGVWYTPAPVVNFIVRAVDDILKTEFDLPQGLADSSKTKITIPSAYGHPSKTQYLLFHFNK